MAVPRAWYTAGLQEVAFEARAYLPGERLLSAGAYTLPVLILPRLLNHCQRRTLGEASMPAPGREIPQQRGGCVRQAANGPETALGENRRAKAQSAVLPGANPALRSWVRALRVRDARRVAPFVGRHCSIDESQHCGADLGQRTLLSPGVVARGYLRPV
ncbi:MAG TPA: hypothetical protein VGF67_07800 [Ktedonobacteraceae bacterium]